MGESHIPPSGDIEHLEKVEKENIRLQGEVIRMQSVIATLLENEERRTAREHDHRRRLAELERAVTKDEMTGLLNRKGFEEVMGRHLREVARVIRQGTDKPRPATYVYIDFDRFKPINDLFGHHAGDIVFMKIGSAFLHTLRPTDYVARLGGDEFAVLLHGVSERKMAEYVIEKVRTAMHQITIDVADSEQLELFYKAVGRPYLLEFSAGYFVITDAQLSARQIEDLAEHDVPKLSILRPKRGEYAEHKA